MLKKTIIGALIGASALVGATSLAYADEAYIPLISKGFQHQFWQAVKAGAEQAAKEQKVRITFEGPETEAMVDKQIDMLSAALAKKPQAIGIAALDSKAAIPLLKRAQNNKIPIIAFDSGVDSDIPLTTCSTDNLAAAALAGATAFSTR
jgi:ribose transport system substrate-binding protein